MLALPLVTLALVAASIASASLARRGGTIGALFFTGGFLVGAAYAPLPLVLVMIPLLLASAVLAGTLTAALPTIPTPAAALLAAALGWGCGIATAPDHGSPGAVVASLGGTLAAALCGIVALSLVLRAIVRLVGPPVGPVGLRVLGAWTAAVASMMLALNLAP